MSGRRAAVLLVAAALVAALALAAVVRVPPGGVGVIGKPGREARMVHVGWHLKAPIWEHSRVFPSNEIPVDGVASEMTAEGAKLSRPYSFVVQAGRADAGALLSLAPDGDLPDASRRAADAVFSRRSATGQGETDADLTRSLEVALGPLGLVPGSISLETAAPAGRKEASELARIRATWKGPEHPVLLIGIDSADWTMMGPAIDRGELPVLGSLRQRGAWGALRSMKPMLSPLLWTTIATGKSPDQHGIVDFLARDPATGKEVPITSRFRKTKALWSILTDLGQPSLTVGWWATWPAESVDGVMISDRVAYSLFKEGGRSSLTGAVYPPALEKDLAPLVVQPGAITYGELHGIIGVSEAEYRKARASLDQVSSYKDPVAHLLRILAATRTYHAMALHELRASQPPLALVYYEGLDEVNHRFAACAPPAMRWCPKGEAKAYGGAVENFYRLQDRLVGELIGAVAPDTVVLVVSDHGFAWGDARPTDVPPDIEGKPGRWHMSKGIFLAAGPPVKPGRLPTDPNLIDVTPTLLALLSLPQAADMPGRVIAEVAPAGALPPAEPARIATYEGGAAERGVAAQESPGVDAEMMAKLTALGYVGSPAAAPKREAPGGTEGGAAPGTVTGDLNEANSLLARGKFEEAEPKYRAALALAPRFVAARLGLAQCLVATGREDEGWKELDDALMHGADLDAGIYMKVARYLSEKRRFLEGASLFERLPRREGLEGARLAAVGVLLMAAGRKEEAERSLRASLAVDPALPESLQAMYDVLTPRGEYDDLIRILEAALKARPGSVVATNFLALTYERAGRADEGRKLLENLLKRDSRDVATLINLAGMLMRAGEDAKALPLAERVREVDPSNVQGLTNLIFLKGKLKDLAGARKAYASAGASAEKVPVLNAMAYACYLNGALEEARSLLSRSLALSPDQQEAKRLLSAVEAGSPAPAPAGGPGL